MTPRLRLSFVFRAGGASVGQSTAGRASESRSGLQELYGWHRSSGISEIRGILWCPPRLLKL